MKGKTSLTPRQQVAIQKDNLGRMIISRTAQLQGYDKGMTSTEMLKFLFKGIPKKVEEQIIQKQLMKDVITGLRRNFGYPLLCCRGDGNVGEFRYFVADEKGLDTYNTMMISIEDGVEKEREAMTKRFDAHQNPSKSKGIFGNLLKFKEG